jgi:hypothetical protein
LFPIQILTNAQKFYQSMKKETQELNTEIEELNNQSLMENNNESESGPNSDHNKKLMNTVD